MDSQQIGQLPDRVASKSLPARNSTAVLVVERDDATRSLLLERIAADGHRCDGASTADQARTLADLQHYDFLLASIGGNSDGAQVDLIRSLTAAGTALLALTDRADPRQVQLAYKLGALALGQSSACREEPETANLSGRLGGQPDEGALPPEVDAAMLLECAPERQTGDAAEQGQEHAGRRSGRCQN